MQKILRAACLVFLLGTTATTAFSQAVEGSLKLRSPNNRVEIGFALDQTEAPAYAVLYDGREIIAPSRLGLVFKEGGLLSQGMKVAKTLRSAHDETYELVVGKTKRARDNYRELDIFLEETRAPYRKLQLVFRANANTAIKNLE